MTRHAHIFPNPSRRGTISDRAVAAMRFGTVRGALSVEVVFFHHALEAFAFRAANHVDEIARLKLGDAEIHFAFRQISFQPKLAHEFLRRDVRFLEISELGFAHARLLCSANPTRTAE